MIQKIAILNNEVTNNEVVNIKGVGTSNMKRKIFVDFDDKKHVGKIVSIEKTDKELILDIDSTTNLKECDFHVSFKSLKSKKVQFDGREIELIERSRLLSVTVIDPRTSDQVIMQYILSQNRIYAKTRVWQYLQALGIAFGFWGLITVWFNTKFGISLMSCGIFTFFLFGEIFIRKEKAIRKIKSRQLSLKLSRNEQQQRERENKRTPQKKQRNSNGVHQREKSRYKGKTGNNKTNRNKQESRDNT